MARSPWVLRAPRDEQVEDTTIARQPALFASRRSDHLAPLARAAAEGDSAAIATLLAHVSGPMLAVVRKVLGRNSPDIDDVTQDALIGFLDAVESFRGDCSVLHFAHRVALLTALAARRRQRVRNRWSADEEETVEELAGDDQESPLARAVAARRRALVRQLLDELPDVIAEALALHFIVGHTVDEIAIAAEISPNTVWSRLRLGKQALRRKLERDTRLAEMLELGE